MKTVRQFSRVGPCLVLGEPVMQTATRIFCGARDGKTAWAMKSSELLVHLEPCPSCRDHERSISPTCASPRCAAEMSRGTITQIIGLVLVEHFTCTLMLN